MHASHRGGITSSETCSSPSFCTHIGSHENVKYINVHVCANGYAPLPLHPHHHYFPQLLIMHIHVVVLLSPCLSSSTLFGPDHKSPIVFTHSYQQTTSRPCLCWHLLHFQENTRQDTHQVVQRLQQKKALYKTNSYKYIMTIHHPWDINTL